MLVSQTLRICKWDTTQLWMRDFYIKQDIFKKIYEVHILVTSTRKNHTEEMTKEH